MKRAKQRLDMTFHAPVEVRGKNLDSIMNAQNTTDRGDGDVRKIMMSFQVEEPLKNELKIWCKDNGMKIGEAVNQAIRAWLESR